MRLRTQQEETRRPLEQVERLLAELAIRTINDQQKASHVTDTVGAGSKPKKGNFNE